MPETQQWRRNLFAIATAQFIALGGANLVFPFMPFYVQDLGVTDPDHVAIWSGLLATATGTMLFIFSPIWGSLADRYGRKQMLLRAYVGAMVTITLQGLVQNVWQLVLLRGLQGIFVGTIPAATALVASGTPRDRIAYALGVVQMALFTSQFVGPLVGGVMAESLGFRTTFLVSGAFYVVSFVLVFAMVQESFVPPTASERGSFFGNLRDVLEIRPVLLLIVVVFFLERGASFIRPLIPLVIESFDPELSAATLSGIAFAALSIDQRRRCARVEPLRRARRLPQRPRHRDDLRGHRLLPARLRVERPGVHPAAGGRRTIRRRCDPAHERAHRGRSAAGAAGIGVRAWRLSDGARLRRRAVSWAAWLRRALASRRRSLSWVA